MYTDPSSLRKHFKNHSKEEQEVVKMMRETWSQGRSTDNSQEGLLEQDTAPNLALLCSPVGGYLPPGYEVGGMTYEPPPQPRPEVTFRRGVYLL